MMNNKRQKNKGFTLIELLVSVALFTIVVTITIGTVTTIIDINRKSQTLTQVINNLNFSLEAMTRTIKTATEVEHKGGYLHFEDQGGYWVAYRLNGEQIEICKITSGNCSGGSFTSITSSAVKVEHFHLEMYDSDANQPRILMTVGGYAEITSDIRSDFDIQTTVSLRKLDVDTGS